MVRCCAIHGAQPSRSQFRRILHITLATIAVLGPSGCTRGPTPEQLHADSTFVMAKQALEAGHDRQGEELIRSAMDLDRHLGRIDRLGDESRLLGDICAAKAQYDSALSSYNQSLEYFRSLTNRSAIRSITIAIGSLYHRLGDDRKAFNMYIEARRLSHIFDSADSIHALQWAILPACRALDEREEERHVLTELQNTYTSSKDPSNLAQVHFAWGQVRFDDRDYSRALESYIQALSFAEQARDSLLCIRSLLRLAITYDKLEKYVESFQAYAEGLKRSDMTQGARLLREEMLVRVGNVYLRSGQYSDASRFYRAALSSAINRQDRITEGYMLIQLGHCDALGHAANTEGKNNYQIALSLFNEISFPPGMAYAHIALALADERNNQWTEALNEFRSAIEQNESFLVPRRRDDLYSECEQVFLRNEFSSPYDNIVELLLQLGRYEEAFWYTERKNSHEMFDMLSSMDIQTRSQELNNALKSFQHQKALRLGAERQLTSLLQTDPENQYLLEEVRANLSRATKTMEDSGARVVQLNKAFEPAVRIRNLGLEEVQKSLAPGTMFIEHVATRRSLYAFVVANNKAAVQLAAAGRDTVLSAAREFTRMLTMRGACVDSPAVVTKPMDQRIQQLSGFLYSAFIRPIEGDITGAARLVLVEQNDLASLPVHALHKWPAGSKSQYLAEQFLVSYLPSATALMLSSVSMLPEHEIVAMGHAGTTSWDVEYELRDIRAFYKDTRFYFNQDATLATLQKEHGDVLHLAAEFRFDGRVDQNSYFVLSDGKSLETTSRVPLGELCSLQPFATIVVSDLGEHATGIHEIQPVMFLLNGSTSVIVSSYPPLRKTKKYFGEIFYTSLLGGSSGEQAFRQVELAMIKSPEYSTPYIWAPFFLWGK